MSEKRVGVGFGVMLLKDDKVLLGKRHEDPQKASSLLNGAGQWTMPGGKLEFGERLEEGAKRELLEETGMYLEEASIICLNQEIIETAHFITVGVLSEHFSGSPKVMEPDEITVWQWFDLNHLPTPMYAPSQKIVNNYLQGKFYISEH